MRKRAPIFVILALAVIVAGVALVLHAPERQPPRCDYAATRVVAFTAPDAEDQAVVTAQGQSCFSAAMTLSLQRADGTELWRYQTDYAALAFGAVGPEGPSPVSAEEMQAFLARWAELTVSRASALPEWPANAERLAEADGGALFADTPLAREPYQALRAADAPTACYAASLEVSHCLSLDAATGKARLVAAFGPHGVELRMPQ